MALEQIREVEQDFGSVESLEFLYSFIADGVIDAGGGVNTAFEDEDVRIWQIPNDLHWLRAGIVLSTGRGGDLGLALFEHRQDIFEKGFLELHLGLSAEKTTSQSIGLDYLKYLIKDPRLAQARIVPWESHFGKPGLKFEASTFDPNSRRRISKEEEMWPDLRASVLKFQAAKLIPTVG